MRWLLVAVAVGLTCPASLAADSFDTLTREMEIFSLLAANKLDEAEREALAEVAVRRPLAVDDESDERLVRVLLLLIKIYRSQERWNDMVVTLNDAVEVMNCHGGHKDHPLRIDINFNYGFALMKRKQPELAQVYFERAVEYADKRDSKGIEAVGLDTRSVLLWLGDSCIAVMNNALIQRHFSIVVPQLTKAEAAFARAAELSAKDNGEDHNLTKEARSRLSETRQLLKDALAKGM